MPAPATAALRAVIARTAAIARCLGIVYIAVQLAIWHSFYAASPWRLAVPAATAAWGAGAAAYLRRRTPGWRLACLDAGVYIAIALGAGWCTPPAVRGSPAAWLFLVIVGQMFVLGWFTPVYVFLPLAVAAGAAFRAGDAVTRSAGFAGHRPAITAVFLSVVAAMHLCSRVMLYRRAATLDTGLADADREAREQYVLLSRGLERREHERILHDTVLNTLTALAHGTSGDAVVGRCQHDVRLMEYVLGAHGGPDTTADRRYGGLLAAVEAVATEMRARGLDVHVVASDTAPGPAVPVPVAVAMAYAVREALVNVAGHAGTGEAWVDVRPGGPGGDGAWPDAVEITVRDKGAGFDPARVDPARLGLRRSITERIADCGGQASIVSAPGAGTTVTVRWSVPPPDGPGATAGGLTAAPW